MNIEIPGNIIIRKLYPSYWKQQIETAEDIIYIGRDTINLMIAHKVADLGGHLRYREEAIMERLGLIMMGREYILALSRKHENPSFPIIGYRYWDSKYCEPLDKDSAERREGTTTLNCCGWCKYAYSIFARNRYNLTANCSFRSLADMGDYSRLAHGKCFLTSAPQSVLDLITEGLNREKNRLRAEVKQVESEIVFLWILEGMAENRPVLPEHRQHGWWKVGDKVVYIVDNIHQFDIKLAQGEIVALGEYPEVRSEEGCIIKYAWKNATICKTWEFQYFLDNPEFAEFWIRNCPISEYPDFNGTGFKKALDKYREEFN